MTDLLLMIEEYCLWIATIVVDRDGDGGPIVVAVAQTIHTIFFATHHAAHLISHSNMLLLPACHLLFHQSITVLLSYEQLAPDDPTSSSYPLQIALDFSMMTTLEMPCKNSCLQVASIQSSGT